MLASSPINSSPTLGPSANMPSTKYLAKQDREALLQFTKHFVRKAVQIIVQSRLGDKKPTKSRVYAYNADWFNLSIKDLAQITTMTKASLGNVEAIFTDNTPFCVEISLRTPESQTMILETWCILFNEQLADPTQKICYSVYKKMSLVLRSLICLTRSIPTYQLSRRQNSDTYVLLYRMYCGEPIVHHLGENYGTGKVGTVGTPIGSLIVNVAYRTRLTMTPHNSSHASEYGGGIQIKDDHFVAQQRQQRQGNKPIASASSPDLQPPNYDELANNYSPTDNRSPRMAFDRANDSAASPISRRSTSNLNTIAESAPSYPPETPTQVKPRVTSKTQPIPMKSSQSQPIIAATNQASNTPRAATAGQQSGKNLQLQRYVDQHPVHAEETSSADEYSSSVGSTSDTIYYFKLKSAAFVPSAGSASFSNQPYSSSFGNLVNDSNDLPPFIALLSNDFGNNLSVGISNQPDSQLAIAQSPPPPNTLIEFNQRSQRNNNVIPNTSSSLQDERIASPCSLPNFKMLDNQAFFNSPTAALINHQIDPDDFVFIESKKIAFGLSNAADDLRNFFRACENAPMLDSFHNEPLFNDVLKDLDQQLLSYESKVAEFDDLIKSLENN